MNNRLRNMDSNNRRLIDNHNHYAKAYDVFCKYSSKHEILSKWAEEVFPKVVVEKLSKGLVEGGTKLRTLGIGSASGFMDCKLISCILRKFPDVCSTIVEPMQSHIDRFKENAAEESLLSVEWDWNQTTWQQYYDDLTLTDIPSTKFHFVSSIHSLYHIPNLEKTIKEFLACLEDGGILLLKLTADFSDVRRFPKRCQLPDENFFNTKNAEDVKQILKTLSIPFETTRVESFVDITPCFDSNNKDGQMLFDFLMQEVHFHFNKSPIVIEDILKRLSEPDLTSTVDGKTILRNDWEAIVIQKKQEI
ncbi:histamine N-methyltransferase-like isoform X1 [Apostichopus japonicus]|uniref:histamine N-methyltransferase-like isoform X1 n=2 Tax=Stichopus japonicus TaxID=307972 RepID=UPI003AB656E6